MSPETIHQIRILRKRCDFIFLKVPDNVSVSGFSHEVHPAGIRIGSYLGVTGYIHFIRRGNSITGQIVHATNK